MIKHRGLDPAEAEVERIAARFGWAKLYRSRHGSRCASQLVQNGSARIAEAEQFGNFVVGFAGGIVTRLPQLAILESGAVYGDGRFFQ